MLNNMTKFYQIQHKKKYTFANTCISINVVLQFYWRWQATSHIS